MGRRFLTSGWLVGHLLVLAAVLVCLRLGWWQWDRTRDADGTLQNLAYAVLWPAFGAGFIYMWVRFLQLEKNKDTADDHAMDDGIAALLTDGTDGAETGGGPDTGTAPDVDVADHDRPGEQPVGEHAGDNPAPIGDAPPPDREDGEIFVGIVDVDDEDDPELAAYNRALAELAEEDRRRAR